MARINLEELPKFINKELDRRKKIAAKEWGQLARELAKAAIINEIKSGKSPVKGGGNNTGGKSRFKGYSDSYEDAIDNGRYSEHGKRKRPVNLTLTGKMLKSIKDRGTKNGFVIWFSDEKAKYHNEEGAGKSRVIRQMLPLPGQQFSRTITQQIEKLYVSIFESIK